MSTLVEMTARLVSSQVSNTSMSTDQIISELSKVFTCLKNLESGQQGEAIVETNSVLTIKEAFKKNEVICMVCGKGFTTLTRHLSTAHDMNPKEYRKQFGISSKQPLAARSYSQAKRKSALDRGLGDILAKARAAKIETQNSATVVVDESPVVDVAVAV
jgi:predicted transcriptional regulator